MYHGSDFPADEFDLTDVNPSSGAFDLCLTDDDGIAEMYATRWPSDTATVYEMEMADDAVVADEEQTFEALGYTMDEVERMSPSERFHAVDSSLSALRDAGFDAVTYMDQMPGTTTRFETTRVIQPGAVKVVDAMSC